jgi:hypothetical protein
LLRSIPSSGMSPLLSFVDTQASAAHVRPQRDSTAGPRGNHDQVGMSALQSFVRDRTRRSHRPGSRRTLRDDRRDHASASEQGTPGTLRSDQRRGNHQTRTTHARMQEKEFTTLRRARLRPTTWAANPCKPTLLRRAPAPGRARTPPPAAKRKDTEAAKAPQAAITPIDSAYQRTHGRNGHTGQNAREANAGYE